MTASTYSSASCSRPRTAWAETSEKRRGWAISRPRNGCSSLSRRSPELMSLHAPAPHHGARQGGDLADIVIGTGAHAAEQIFLREPENPMSHPPSIRLEDHQTGSTRMTRSSSTKTSIRSATRFSSINARPGSDPSDGTDADWFHRSAEHLSCRLQDLSSRYHPSHATQGHPGSPLRTPTERFSRPMTPYPRLQGLRSWTNPIGIPILHEVVTQAMETIPTKKVTEWVKNKLGQSLQSKRNIAFSTTQDAEQQRDHLLDSI